VSVAKVRRHVVCSAEVGSCRLVVACHVAQLVPGAARPGLTAAPCDDRHGARGECDRGEHAGLAVGRVGRCRARRRQSSTMPSTTIGTIGRWVWHGKKPLVRTRQAFSSYCVTASASQNTSFPYYPYRIWVTTHLGIQPGRWPAGATARSRPNNSAAQPVGHLWIRVR
jgi:hypothetical protein